MQSESAHRDRKGWLLLLPFPLFVLLGTAFFWNVRGDDLASSYVGCRVLATHQEQSLYSYDPENFASIGEHDVVWPQLAIQGGYHGWLHPYVQTPLWAWLLQPMCTHMAWPTFLRLFLFLSLCAVAGIVYLTARYWAQALYTPGRLSMILALIAFSEPFLYAMVLVQTHALLLLLALAGLMLAERGRPMIGGLAVALAAAVKITPAFLLLYWLAGRRWRAALSFVGWSALLLAGTRLVLGAPLFHAYLASMHRVSQVLLVSENNQSLAAWYMGRFFSPDEVFDVNAFALPATVRLVSMAATAAAAIAGGWLDKDGTAGSADLQEQPMRYGAAITLVAMTIFAPIAWSHYFIVMAVPLMLLAQAAVAARRRGVKVLLWVSVGLCGALLFRPLAPDVIRMDLSDFAVLRGEFEAGALCLLVLVPLAWQARRRA